MTYSGPQTAQQFHQQKEADLQALIASKPSPELLNRFVQNYKRDFSNRFFGRTPSARTTIPLFMTAGNYYITRYADKLRTIKNDPTKSIADLATLMDSFIADFPDGSKTLIHYQNTPVLELLSKDLNAALINKYGNKGYYNMMKNGRCAEASLLQSLAMLPIAISAPISAPVSAKARTSRKSTKRASSSSSSSSSSQRPILTTQLTPYGEIIEEFINRAATFFTKSKSIPGKHLTMTAAALSHFDIEAFAKIEMTDHRIMPDAFVANRAIERFVNSCINLLNQTSNAAVIIRAMHAILLVSPSTDLKKYLTEKDAGQLLNVIAHTTFNPSNPEDRALVNQLFFIKNTYPNVFPAALEKSMAPFVKIFQQQSHGSKFEDQIHNDIEESATELAKQYPGLIDPRKFDFDNPISAALGLESDVTYEDGENKVCFQIDGKKYHLYLGSSRETQRTKLRDHCFKSQAWKLVKFTDDTNGVLYATEQLKENVVIPTFEIKTANNISAVQKVASKLEETSKDLASLTIDAQMSALRQLQEQTTQAIAAGNTLRGDEKTRVVGDLTALERNLSKLQAVIEVQQNRVNHDLPAQLHDIQTELKKFDYNAAEKLTRFSHQTAMLRESFIATQSDACKLVADLQSTEELIRKHEHTLDSQKNVDSDKAELTTLESRRDALNQQLARYKALKNASVTELKDAGILRTTLNKELIPGLEAQVATIERQVQSLSKALKKDYSAALTARSELEKAQEKKADLVKRQIQINTQLSTISSQLSDFEAQLTAPVMGSALLAKVERIEQTIMLAQQTQLDIASTLANATKTLTDANEFIVAKKAAAIETAKQSKLNIHAAEFKPAPKAEPKTSSSVGSVYYPYPEEMMQAPIMYPAYGMYPNYGYGYVPPFPVYYQQPAVFVPAHTAQRSTPSALLHAYPKRLAEDRQQELLCKTQSSKEVGVKTPETKEPALKVT